MQNRNLIGEESIELDIASLRTSVADAVTRALLSVDQEFTFLYRLLEELELLIKD